jgi:filamentous hemagglutinin family protein
MLSAFRERHPRSRWLSATVGVLLCVHVTPSWAQGPGTGPRAGQVETDGSLGPRVSLPGPQYTVGPGLGQQRGANLFHSFRSLNVGTGERVTFTGPPSITNVLSRVTGGQQSSIDGTVQSNIRGANLFLLNPHGVLFGPNAKLEVSGSFHVSTANVIRLADGGAFHANLNAPGVLTSAPPSAFGFLNPLPADLSPGQRAATDREQLGARIRRSVGAHKSRQVPVSRRRRH